MTMTAQERERLMRLGESNATLITEVEHVKDSMRDIRERIKDMHEHLKGITSDVASIRIQNEGHEEKLAMLQELTASLGETGAQIEKSCKRLKHMLAGFVGLLIVLAVLVGVLGEEVLPKAFKWLWALVGL